jgi:hypothetical protein
MEKNMVVKTKRNTELIKQIRYDNHILLKVGYSSYMESKFKDTVRTHADVTETIRSPRQFYQAINGII